jgi:hypothetical protein
MAAHCISLSTFLSLSKNYVKIVRKEFTSCIRNMTAIRKLSFIECLVCQQSLRTLHDLTQLIPISSGQDRQYNSSPFHRQSGREK